LLPKVLAHHHFDLDLMSASQADDVVSNLSGNGLSETGQVPRSKSGLIHRNQQRARMSYIHQCVMHNHAIKTTQIARNFIAVAAYQINAWSRFQLSGGRSWNCHESYSTHLFGSGYASLGFRYSSFGFRPRMIYFRNEVCVSDTTTIRPELGIGALQRCTKLIASSRTLRRSSLPVPK